MKTNPGFYAILLFMISSCAVSIQSQKSSDYEKKINKIHVFIVSNKEKFSSKFALSFKTYLSQNALNAEFETIDIASFNADTNFNNNKKKIIPGAFMIFYQTSISRQGIGVSGAEPSNGTGPYPKGTFVPKPPYAQPMFAIPTYANGGSFDVMIYVPNIEEPVWYGTANCSTGGFGNLTVVAKMLAETLYRAMKIDKII